MDKSTAKRHGIKELFREKAILNKARGEKTSSLVDLVENTGRMFLGMELDEGYFEIAQKRLEEVME